MRAGSASLTVPLFERMDALSRREATAVLAWLWEEGTWGSHFEQRLGGREFQTTREAFLEGFRSIRGLKTGQHMAVTEARRADRDVVTISVCVWM